MKIASPCSAKWEHMKGDDRTRFCAACQKNVYNVAQLSEAEARELLATHEGHVCMRIFRRRDGRVITKDCPVGRRRIFDQRLRKFAFVATWVGLIWEALRWLPNGPMAEPLTGDTIAVPSYDGRPIGEGGGPVKPGVDSEGTVGKVAIEPLG